MSSMMNAFQGRATKTVGVKVGGDQRAPSSFQFTCALVAFAACATISMDISHLCLAIGGAVAYWFLTHVGLRTKHQKTISKSLIRSQCKEQLHETPQASHAESWRARRPSKPQPQVKTSTAAAPIQWQPSAQPIRAPVFNSSGWDAEVKELLSSLPPTTEADEAIQGLVRIIQRVTQEDFPTATVESFVWGNPFSAKPFNVAIPEVDVVLKVDIEDLRRDLDSHLSDRQVVKYAIRTCCSQLVKLGGLKFRRSVFQSDEPRVILSVPTSVGVADAVFPVTFSVNAFTPQRTAVLLKECAQIDYRAKELSSLVRRWARDRGISHAPTGHVSPYAWTLLSVHFLQKGLEEGAALLPPMDKHLKEPSTNKRNRRKQMTKAKLIGDCDEKTCAALFKKFVQFYVNRFDLSKEVVTVCSACCAKPKAWAMPIIEDPFDAAHNFGDGVNSVGMERFREELTRADAMCTRGASLSELLEPWVPPVIDSWRSDDNEDIGEADEDSWQEKRKMDAVARQKKSATVAAPGQLTAALPLRLAPQSGSLTALPERLGPSCR